MRGVKVKKTSKKDELFKILKKNVKKTYNESPFKSIILDTRSILPKKGCKKIKKGLEYVEEIKELTFLQIENGKTNLIKLKNDLIERFKRNDRRRRADRDYYEYEESKFHGLKDVRNLFNQNDDDDNYEGIKYLFDESIMNYFSKLKYLEYEELKKLLSVKPKKELIVCFVTKGIIEQEYAIDYDVNFYRANYRRCERVQEIDYIRFKTFLVKESSDYTIDNEAVRCFELVNDQIIESCEIIEDQKVESCELIEEHDAKIIESCELIEDHDAKIIESCEITEDKKVEYCEIIEDQKVESCELIEDHDVKIIGSCEVIENQRRSKC